MTRLHLAALALLCLFASGCRTTTTFTVERTLPDGTTARVEGTVWH